VNNLLCSF